MHGKDSTGERPAREERRHREARPAKAQERTARESTGKNGQRGEDRKHKKQRPDKAQERTARQIKGQSGPVFADAQQNSVTKHGPVPAGANASNTQESRKFSNHLNTRASFSLSARTTTNKRATAAYKPITVSAATTSWSTTTE